MDYAVFDDVKGSLGAETTNTIEDALLAKKITQASRMIDVICTGVAGVSDYFRLETVAGEIIRGIPDVSGKILCYPRKPVVTSVLTVEWSPAPRQQWQTVDPSLDVTFDDPRVVTIWEQATALANDYVRVRIDYTGGFGAQTASLPEDVQNFALLLAIRLYKEEKGGLSDSIGVAELGMLQYTKALPVRFVEMIQHYKRLFAW